MQCPSCYHLKNKVVMTRHNIKKNITFRRRVCKKCKFRFTTYESLMKPDATPLGTQSMASFDLMYGEMGVNDKEVKCQVA